MHTHNKKTAHNSRNKNGNPLNVHTVRNSQSFSLQVFFDLDLVTTKQE